MKKIVITILFLFLIVPVSASCDLNMTLLNQDPYPAVPGEYVKLVFQVKGIESSDCKDIIFNLPEKYPIEFNPGESGIKRFKKVDYLKDYKSNLLVPYEVRINKDALDGTTPIEAKVQSVGDPTFSKNFDIEIDNVRADFEVYVKDYQYKTHELTIEVLNIEDSDIEALTVEIPKQENVLIKGPNRIVVGDLDSNEYTTAEFEAIPTDGEIKINLIYSDTINIRRTIQKTIIFDSSYFDQRIADVKTTSKWTYIFGAIGIILIIYWIFKKRKKAKKNKENQK